MVMAITGLVTLFTLCFNFFFAIAAPLFSQTAQNFICKVPLHSLFLYSNFPDNFLHQPRSILTKHVGLAVDVHFAIHRYEETVAVYDFVPAALYGNVSDFGWELGREFLSAFCGRRDRFRMCSGSHGKLSNGTPPQDSLSFYALDQEDVIFIKRDLLQDCWP